MPRAAARISAAADTEPLISDIKATGGIYPDGGVLASRIRRGAFRRKKSAKKPLTQFPPRSIAPAVGGYKQPTGLFVSRPDCGSLRVTIPSAPGSPYRFHASKRVVHSSAWGDSKGGQTLCPPLACFFFCHFFLHEQKEMARSLFTSHFRPKSISRIAEKSHLRLTIPRFSITL